MIVWLWDAIGPEVSQRGVTDDEEKALQAAEALIRSRVVRSVRIEMALAHVGIRTLTPGYERVGQGWTVRRHENGRITRAQFPSSRTRRKAS